MSCLDYKRRKALDKIHLIAEGYFKRPCDFGEIALHQIREITSNLRVEEDRESIKEIMSYSRYINEGD